MNYSLSIKISADKLSGVLFLGNIVSSSITQPYTDLESGLNALISGLLNYSSTSSEKIKNFFLTADFPSLYLQGKLTTRKIGHIRYQPPFSLHNTAGNPWNECIIIHDLSDIKNLPEVLDLLKVENIDVLNINPSFFAWSTLSETAIRCQVAKILGSNVLVQSGATFYETRYWPRENSTLANCILLHGVNRFYDFLKALLLGHGLTAPIYTMKNNGMLATEDYMRKYPLYSYGSLIADQLLILANQEQTNEIMLITQEQKYLNLSMTENGLPVTSFSALNFGQVSLNLFYPTIKSIQLLKSKDEMQLGENIKIILRNINPPEKSIILFLDNIEKKYRNLLVRICQELLIPVGNLEPRDKHGALCSPFSVEQEHFIFYETEIAMMEKQEMLFEELRKQAKAYGFSPDEDWKFYYEEKPIHYLHQHASAVRVGFFGPRRN